MNTETRKARKEHTCVLCYTPILPSTKYLYQRITPWDHPMNEHFFDYKVHKECHKQWKICGSYHENMLPESFSMWMRCFTGYHGLRIDVPDRKSFNPETSYEKMFALEALQ